MKIAGEHLISHHIFRGKFTDLDEVYTVMSFRSFIVAFIGIFEPIYLWTLGFSLPEVLMFYVVFYSGEAFLELPTTYLLAKFGPKNLIALSMPVLVVHFFMLWTVPNFHWSIYIVALIGSVASAIFWQSYHWEFSKSKHSREACKEVGSMVILTSLVAAIAPFIGGMIAGNFGIGYVFGLVTVLLVFSILPLLKYKKKHEVRKVNFKKLKLGQIKYQVISYFGFGIHGAIGLVIWPLFIYLILKSYQEVGLVSSLALVITLVFTYFLSRSADHGKRSKYLKTGSVMTSAIWFIKTIASTFFHIFSLNLLNNIAHAFLYTPFMSEYYLHADEESRPEYLFVMEITADLSRAFTLLMLIFALFFFNDLTVMILGFVVAGFGSLLIGLMPPARGEVEVRDNKVRLIPQPLRRAR